MIRILKYLLYGGFYLVIWGLVIGGAYFLFLKPTASCFDNKQNQNEEGVDCGGSCVSCAIKNLQAFSFSPVRIFENNGLISLLGEIANPNANYGSDSFEYKINLYGTDNNLLDSEIRDSFIYGGETKELVEAGLKINGKVARAEMVLGKINWKPVTEWQAPIIETSGLQFSMNQDAVVVNGLIQNPSNFQISEIIISAVLLDQFGREAGVSKTEIKNLSPFGKMTFQIFAPFNPIMKNNINLNATRVTVKARR